MTSDCRCFCERCEGRTKESYRLYAICANCGTKFQTIHRKGDKHPHNVECPTCGVERTVWGELVPSFEYDPQMVAEESL